MLALGCWGVAVSVSGRARVCVRGDSPWQCGSRMFSRFQASDFDLRFRESSGLCSICISSSGRVLRSVPPGEVRPIDRWFALGSPNRRKLSAGWVGDGGEGWVWARCGLKY